MEGLWFRTRNVPDVELNRFTCIWVVVAVVPFCYHCRCLFFPKRDSFPLTVSVLRCFFSGGRGDICVGIWLWVLIWGFNIEGTKPNCMPNPLTSLAKNPLPLIQYGLDVGAYVYCRGNWNLQCYLNTYRCVSSPLGGGGTCVDL